jgi:23S rRNA-/tRNA-specific pseudouridylate synthase
MGHLPVEIESGVIDLALQRDHAHPPFMRVATPASQAAALEAVKDLQQHGYKKLMNRKPKQSQTEFTVLERCTVNDLAFTRLGLVPITGRTHQLRVHCAALGFPILGDPAYSLYGEAHPVGGLDQIPKLVQGVEEINGCSLDLQKAWNLSHVPNTAPMCLHAARLCFEHPVTGKKMDFQIRPAF